MRCSRESTLGDLMVSIQHVLGKPLDAGYVLVQGADVLGGPADDVYRRPFLGVALAEGEEVLQLTLVLRQRPAVRKALSEIIAGPEVSAKGAPWASLSGRRQDRVRALRSLKREARRGDGETIDALVALLKDERCGLICREAASALAEVVEDGDHRAIDAWAVLSDHPDLDVQKRAVQALFRLRRGATAEDKGRSR